jgi:hypothetical protein
VCNLGVWIRCPSNTNSHTHTPTHTHIRTHARAYTRAHLHASTRAQVNTRTHLPQSFVYAYPKILGPEHGTGRLQQRAEVVVLEVGLVVHSKTKLRKSSVSIVYSLCSSQYGSTTLTHAHTHTQHKTKYTYAHTDAYAR